MSYSLHHIANAIGELFAEDRQDFKRIDASPALYDDGSWLKPRR